MSRAIDYVNAGLVLVPIPLGQKGPNLSGWNESSNVITTPEAAASLTGNVGLAHAYCTPRPTAALDIDDHKAAFEWLFQRGVDLQTLMDAPDAVRIESGRQNRAKLLFVLPQSVTAMPSVQVLEPDTAKVLFELRCASRNGKTMQDVLPPSIHPETGKPYQWAGGGHFAKLPILPNCLLAIWHELLAGCKSGGAASGRTNPHSAKNFGEPETPRRIAHARLSLSFIDADCSYPLYRDVVWAMADTGWSCVYELLEEWSQNAPHRFNGDTLGKLIASYSPDGGIHFGTLIHHARLGGRNG